ncbi:MAG: glycosyltransferase family 1 protein [Pedobacter sp.]|jgi:glycosyltransferase involved in cell wall biosynthesis|nr:glycosyltransferase family 1 protein [Pedobacter sp.]
MIKIFYDHQKFSTQKYGGISRYFANLLEAIEDAEEFEYVLGVFYSTNHYLQQKPWFLDNVLAERLLESEHSRKIFKINEHYSKHILGKNNFDIFHPTYYDPYFLERLNKPLVTTIHDMTYERLPEYFWANDPLTFHKRLSVEHADKIIAISETTKNDILQYTTAKPEQIHVVYHGIDCETPLTFATMPELPESYLLYVGDRSGYKNFYLFMNAYSKIKEKYPDLQVILTGGGRLGIADMELIKRLKIGDQVTHLSASDEQLNTLYQKALFFVYPSLHEGFGLPILEAFKAQCPMLLSDTDCFREIAADAAEFFNPRDLDHLVHSITDLITNESRRRELVVKGNARLLHFPIKKSTDETFAVYKTLA